MKRLAALAILVLAGCATAYHHPPPTAEKAPAAPAPVVVAPPRPPCVIPPAPAFPDTLAAETASPGLIARYQLLRKDQTARRLYQRQVAAALKACKA